MLDEEEDKEAVEQLVDVRAMTMGHKRPAPQPAAAPLAPRALPSPLPSKASLYRRLTWASKVVTAGQSGEKFCSTRGGGRSIFGAPTVEKFWNIKHTCILSGERLKFLSSQASVEALLQLLGVGSSQNI